MLTSAYDSNLEVLLGGHILSRWLTVRVPFEQCERGDRFNVEGCSENEVLLDIWQKVSGGVSTSRKCTTNVTSASMQLLEECIVMAYRSSRTAYAEMVNSRFRSDEPITIAHYNFVVGIDAKTCIKCRAG